jgi:hypothetical protein
MNNKRGHNLKEFFMKMSLSLSKKNKIREMLFEKIRGKSSPHISIYLPGLDTYYTANTRKEDFKHFLSYAFYYLQKDHPIEDVLEIEKEIYSSDELDVLSKTENAIGFFYKKGFCKMLELPIQVSKKVIAANSFHIKPIIEIEQMASSFFYYNLKKDRIDVFEGTPWQIEKIKSYSYLDFYHFKKNILEKTDIESFYKKVINEESVRINKDNNTLIILNGVEYLQTIFQKKMNTPITRIVLNESKGELKQQVFESLKKYFSMVRQGIIADFQSYRGTGKLVHNLDEAFLMAQKGKISKLIVANDVIQWGQQTSSGEILKYKNQKNSQDDDLLDDMAEEVLRSGGEVYCFPKHLLPFDNSFSALLK